MGFYTGALLCDGDCNFDESGCAEFCGDGIVQPGHEQCDGTNHDGEDCESLGYHPGELACSAGCEFAVSGCDGRCGDGVIQSTWEDCDGVNLAGLTCGLRGYLFRGTLYCDAGCGFDGCVEVGDITAGDRFSCAVLRDGTARCWGTNGSGRLGDGTNTQRNTPVAVSGLTGVVSLSAGKEHACAVLSNGTAKCWGDNWRGQLGDGTIINRSIPVTVSGLTGVVGIAAGGEHTCAVLSNGTARCWGRNQRGQLSDGCATNQCSTPVTVSGLTGVVGITAGNEHTCAVLSDGTARCWGFNMAGQLGDGTTLQRTSPVVVSSLSGALGISAGDAHTCARLGDGTARCWGSNGNGRLGTGNTTSSLTPVQVVNLTGAETISAGSEHTCAVLTNGTARCWGKNADGRLGDGTTTDKLSPAAVNTPKPVSGIAAGRGIYTSGHSCALVDQGRNLQCWGENSFGQLGDNTTTNRLDPTLVVALYSLMSENFEALSLPAGWSIQGSVWGVGTPGAGPSSCALGSTGCAGTNTGGNYLNNMLWGNHCLESKELLLDGLSGARLQFHSWMDVEVGLDGGRIQIYVDGSWQDFDDSRLSTAYTHNFGGQAAWSHDQLWTQYTVDLSAHVGKTVRLRFCFYSNNVNTEHGWFIDEFRITAW